MCRDKKYVKGKEHKKLLIVFANAVVNPWTVVIHFFNTSLANTTMMGSQRLNTQAPRTPVNNLTGVFGLLFNVLRRCIAQWHRSIQVQKTFCSIKVRLYYTVPDFKPFYRQLSFNFDKKNTVEPR